MPSISTERLRELLSYDPLTGQFTRLTGKHAGKPAGCIDASKKGYVRIVLDGKQFYAHRLAWQYVHGKEPDGDIDHRNGKRSENWIKNLRPATALQNQRNYPTPKSNTSGFKGVRRCKATGRWRADIRNGTGKKEYLGHFDTPEEASFAYQVRAKELFGEFVRVEHANDNIPAKITTKRRADA